MSGTAPGDKDNWRDTILAGLANYIDSGSIVAGGAALALWQQQYLLSNELDQFSRDPIYEAAVKTA